MRSKKLMNRVIAEPWIYSSQLCRGWMLGILRKNLSGDYLVDDKK